MMSLLIPGKTASSVDLRRPKLLILQQIATTKCPATLSAESQYSSLKGEFGWYLVVYHGHIEQSPLGASSDIFFAKMRCLRLYFLDLTRSTLGTGHAGRTFQKKCVVFCHPLIFCISKVIETVEHILRSSTDNYQPHP
jgi:hypothetical protein